jgi:uncharacterized membrane protein
MFSGSTYTIERTAPATWSDWLPGDQAVSSVAPATGARTVGRTYDPEVELARAGLASELKKYYGEKLFARNGGSVFMGALIGAVVLGIMIMSNAAPLVIAGFGVVMAAVLVFALKVMPAYTVEGRRLEDEVEGLRQYLGVAEGDDLKLQKRPPRTKEEFAKFLPYAVALDVEKTWADAFAAVLGVAALSAATADYYSSSDRNSMITGSGFTDSIGDMGRTISSASTAPGSSSGGSDSGGSSGGGGGDSGGGGGGGGGSGW